MIIWGTKEKIKIFLFVIICLGLIFNGWWASGNIESYCYKNDIRPILTIFSNLDGFDHCAREFFIKQQRIALLSYVGGVLTLFFIIREIRKKNRHLDDE